MAKLSQYPTLKGWRSKEPTRQENIARLRAWIEECEKIIGQVIPYSHEELERARTSIEVFSEGIAQLQGELAQAWDQVVKRLSAAILDPAIQQNATAVEFLEIMRSLASVAPTHDELDEVVCIDEVFGWEFDDVSHSKRAWAIAKNKNIQVRTWVIDEWNRRTNLAETKESFADRYSEQIRRKFKDSKGNPLDIKARTIETDWLPKGKK